MRQEIIGKQFDAERSLYHLQHADITDCLFAGPADGESVLKEARDIRLENCGFKFGQWYGIVWFEKRLREGLPTEPPTAWSGETAP